MKLERIGTTIPVASSSIFVKENFEWKFNGNSKTYIFPLTFFEAEDVIHDMIDY